MEKKLVEKPRKVTKEYDPLAVGSDDRSSVQSGSDGYGSESDLSDVSDMEAGFDQIEEEELISAQIAEKEDAEELALIKAHKAKKRERKR